MLSYVRATPFAPSLQILGHERCYHMRENIGLNHSDLWSAALCGKPDWQAIFGAEGFSACVDFPAAVAFEALLYL